MQAPPVISDFVSACQAAVLEPAPRERIAQMLQDLIADPATLQEAIPPFTESTTSDRGWTVGESHCFYQSDDLTIMVLDTLPGVTQPPHDHLMTAMIGVFEGIEEQRFWGRTSEGLAAAAGRVLTAGEMVVMGERAVHAISAPDGAPARAIHVYLGDILEVERSVFHPETLEEFPMNDDRYDEFCRPTKGG